MTERFDGDGEPFVEEDDRTRFLHDLHISEGCPLGRSIISPDEAAVLFRNPTSVPAEAVIGSESQSQTNNEPPEVA